MKRFVKRATTVGLSLLPFLAGVSTVLADDAISFNIAPQEQFSELTNITFPSIVSGIITLALVLAALIAFAFLIYGGIVWITSAGDKAKTEQARNTITAALVGLLIVFAAWAIINLLEMFFGIDITSLNLRPFSSSVDAG